MTTQVGTSPRGNEGGLPRGEGAGSKRRADWQRQTWGRGVVSGGG